jgi:hypothetical protein
MNKSLILVAVAFMFANQAVAQEDQASVNEATSPQVQTEEAKKSHQSKELKLKELMDHKEYHYSDGWVEHLSPTN